MNLTLLGYILFTASVLINVAVFYYQRNKISKLNGQLDFYKKEYKRLVDENKKLYKALQTPIDNSKPITDVIDEL